MIWIDPSEKDHDNAALGKRLCRLVADVAIEAMHGEVLPD